MCVAISRSYHEELELSRGALEAVAMGVAIFMFMFMLCSFLLEVGKRQAWILSMRCVLVPSSPRQLPCTATEDRLVAGELRDGSYYCCSCANLFFNMWLDRPRDAEDESILRHTL